MHEWSGGEKILKDRTNTDSSSGGPILRRIPSGETKMVEEIRGVHRGR